MSLKSLAGKLLSGSINIKIAGFNVNLPSLNVTNTSAEKSSLGGFIASPGSIVQTLTKGARGIFCLGAVLTDPSMALNVLSMCGSYIGLMGAQLVNDLYKTCMARVNNILSTSFGILTGYFNTIKNIIKMVQGIGDMIQSIIDFWNNRKDHKLGKLFDKENCDFMVANLLRCMMGKMLEPYLRKVNDSLTQDIDNIGKDIEDKIIKNTSVATSMSKYCDQQAMFVNKFTSQITDIMS